MRFPFKTRGVVIDSGDLKKLFMRMLGGINDEKVFSVFGILVVALLVSGCGTVQGLKKDVQSARETVEGVLFSRVSQEGRAISTPSTKCEFIYKREKSSPRYRVCLEERIMENVSPADIDRLYYGKAFPVCRRIYKNPKADWQGYRKCQGDEWVRKEVSRLVQWRKDLDRRVVATEKTSMGRWK